MKVLFVKDVSGTARAGEIKEVSDGFAKNFLFAKRLAVPASQNLIKHQAKETREHQDKIEREKERVKQIARTLSKTNLVIKAKAGKEHLFAAIHEADLAKALAEQANIEIDPKNIKLPQAIKSLGQHKINIQLNPELKTTVNLDVQALWRKTATQPGGPRLN